MSDNTSKGNVQSVAGSRAKCHTAISALYTVLLAAMLQQSGESHLHKPAESHNSQKARWDRLIKSQKGPSMP